MGTIEQREERSKRQTESARGQVAPARNRLANGCFYLDRYEMAIPA